MPWCSLGFSVATRKKGWGSARATPSTVAWRSSIGSSNADWVRGVARLISSTRTTLAKIGPGTNSNSLRSWWYTVTPVRSEGSRSGVACTRLNVPPIDRATALASVVLPTPGTPSSRRFPSASRQSTAARTAAAFPAITRSTLPTRSWTARAVSKPEGWSSIVRSLHRCATGGDLRLRGNPNTVAGQQHARLRAVRRARTFDGGMNKSGLVAEVAKRTEANRADVAAIVDETMAVIRDTVAKGERVALVGFGTFEKRRRNRRIARNPRQPDVAIPVPARDVPSFMPGQQFKQVVAAKRRRAPAKSRSKPAAKSTTTRKAR